MANREILTILREYRTVGCGESQTGAARRGYYPGSVTNWEFPEKALLF